MTARGACNIAVGLRGGTTLPTVARARLLTRRGEGQGVGKEEISLLCDTTRRFEQAQLARTPEPHLSPALASPLSPPPCTMASTSSLEQPACRCTTCPPHAFDSQDLPKVAAARTAAVCKGAIKGAADPPPARRRPPSRAPTSTLDLPRFSNTTAALAYLLITCYGSHLSP